MNNTWLISGPPGCGKTTWILETLKNHAGPCGYLRLDGTSEQGLQQARNAGIDHAWLKDQLPQLLDLSDSDLDTKAQLDNLLAMIELPQFRAPRESGLNGIDPSVSEQLSTLNLTPDRVLHFGRDPDLPRQDTLDFKKLEAWGLTLYDSVWDPNSLSSFWFELVNGAYGDVYRAKALMNMPDGRAFFCNWMVSQQGSQFLPLTTVAPPHGRPNRRSELVVQGKALDGIGIQTTIDDCLISDEVLEMHQAPMRDRQSEPTTTITNA